MRTKVRLSDFSFIKKGYGLYRVIYESPVTGKCWSTMINDMTLIDATLNADEPTAKNLNMLKWMCKNK